MQRIALLKKKENISEYVIYMYQMEDLIRAYQFDLNDIHLYVIAHYPISADEKAEVLTWFTALAEKMKAQNIQQTGHLIEVQEIVDKLARIHWNLLKTDAVYYKIYSDAKPHVIELILEAGNENPGHEIQVCFNVIYALLLSRLHGKPVPDKKIAATDRFGAVLRYLTDAYHHELVVEN
jgi:hypothetical protein